MAAKLEEQQFCCCRVRGVYLGGLARLWLERATRGQEAEWRWSDVSDQGSLDWNVSTMVSPMPLEPSFRTQGYCQSPRCERIRGSAWRTWDAFDSPFSKVFLWSEGLGWPWVQRGCKMQCRLGHCSVPAAGPLSRAGRTSSSRQAMSIGKFVCMFGSGLLYSLSERDWRS